MLEQVDSQQFTKLGVKYHHLLMKFERSKALLKKRMDMHADLDNIVLQRYSQNNGALPYRPNCA